MTDPINVGWIAEVQGKIGLTFAPGKHGHSKSGPPWARDLAMDLDRLVSVHGMGVEVCLLEDHELKRYRIPTLIEDAQQRGVKVLRLPILDGGVLPELEPVQRIVEQIIAAARSGVNVVIHCAGGLGRAGTIGGCTLIALGHSADDALRILRAKRGRNCPENEEQRDFIRRFAAQQQTPATSSPWSDATAGAVLGAAIGDALGHPTEFLSMEAIHAKYGAAGVQGFELFWERDGKRVAPYTDDTQMAEIVARTLVAMKRDGLSLDDTMKKMADDFVVWAERPQGGHRAPGNACLAGCRALKAGAPWREAGGATAGGCGSVMRAFPFGIAFTDADEAERWAVEHSKLTHRDPIALAACAAIARGMVAVMHNKAPDVVLNDMQTAAARYDEKTAGMIVRAVDEARRGVGPEVTLNRLRAWAAHEAIAAAAYIFARHPDDPRTAILEGANTPGDSDSIATLAGALTGARCGLSSLPKEWVKDVERSDELLALANDLAAKAQIR